MAGGDALPTAVSRRDPIPEKLLLDSGVTGGAAQRSCFGVTQIPGHGGPRNDTAALEGLVAPSAATVARKKSLPP